MITAAPDAKKAKLEASAMLTKHTLKFLGHHSDVGDQDERMA